MDQGDGDWSAASELIARMWGSIGELSKKLAQARTENQEMRDFILEFAEADFAPVRTPIPPRHPADELDPVTDLRYVQAFQDDARALAAKGQSHE